MEIKRDLQEQPFGIAIRLLEDVITLVNAFCDYFNGAIHAIGVKSQAGGRSYLTGSPWLVQVIQRIIITGLENTPCRQSVTSTE